MNTQHSTPDLDQNAHIIVFGNEKGGSGKSTAAIHVAIGLLRLGYRVGTLDLDARQGTLTRMMANRWRYAKEHTLILPMPIHMMVDKSLENDRLTQEAKEKQFMDMALAELGGLCDFIIMDTPGTDNHLSRAAHAMADTVVTPVNDSLIDLDLIVQLNPEDFSIESSGVYTQMIEEQRIRKRATFERERHVRKSGQYDEIRWIVMRNRKSHIRMKHKEVIEDALQQASKAHDFIPVEGFGERIIFRKLFLKGLTLMDIKESAEKRRSLTMSEVKARQEVRNLINAIDPKRYKP